MIRTSARHGFTLIELMVVISIIALLSSVIIRSLSDARAKAQQTAAAAACADTARLIAQCDTAGGNITSPDSQTTPSNSFCSLGAQFGAWSRPPAGWYWAGAYSGQQEDLVVAAKQANVPGYTNFYAGFYPAFSSYCSGPHKGLCRLSATYACTFYNTGTGTWE